VQVSVRDSIDYLYEISRSLHRQGFRRQVYVSLHGPSHVFVSPVIRDFFDEYQAPMLYIDAILPMMKVEAIRAAFTAPGNEDPFTDMIVAAYDTLGRIADVPLTTPETDMSEPTPSTTAFLNRLQTLAPQSGAIGNYFGAQSDHCPTPYIASAEHRLAIAARGHELLDAIVEAVDIADAVARMQALGDFTTQVTAKFPSTRTSV
jgi:creatinine amidohydrolase